MLYQLFTTQDKEALAFQKNIMIYNGIFSFTSLGVRLDKDLDMARSGVYTFRAQGQIYHNLPSLIPPKSGSCFFQLYFHDTQNEVSNRMAAINEAPLVPDIV